MKLPKSLSSSFDQSRPTLRLPLLVAGAGAGAGEVVAAGEDVVVTSSFGLGVAAAGVDEGV
jgi:hypothetical protein